MLLTDRKCGVQDLTGGGGKMPTYAIHEHQRELELLNRLTTDILALKLEAQGRVTSESATHPNAHDARPSLIQLLGELERHIESGNSSSLGSDIEPAFLGLTRRFIQVNPSDVQDRLEQLRRLRARLADDAQPLRDRDYHLLDQVQALFQAETAEGMRNLYRF